jgi:hypothetical protein
MNTDKKYLKEVAVFVVLMFVGFLLLSFAGVFSDSGVEKYCNENPSHCAPAEYPGKVIYND